MRSWRLRLAAGAAAGLLAGGLALTESLDPLEWKTWDWRLTRFADSSRQSNQIAILLIDQKSLDHMEEAEGLPWPWPRGLYVPVIEYCRSAGARGVVFDILFTEFSAFGEADDASLGDAIARGGDVVLPLVVRDGETTTPVSAIGRGASAVGAASIEPDRDGIFRRMAPTIPGRSDTLWTLPFAAFTALCDGDLRFVDDGVHANGRPLPLDRDGSLVVDYRGPRGTIPSYSMAAAIQSYVRDERGDEVTLPKAHLRDRIVFLGMSAPGLLDLRPSPVGGNYPGVEVHATVLDNLLTGRFVTPVRGPATILFCLAIGVGLALALGRIRSAWIGALLLPLAAALVVGVAVVGYSRGIWLPMVAPFAAALLSFLIVRTVDYATEGRERRFLRHAFRHYLSPSVVDQIVRDPSRLTLGGERKELTIFFSDLAGFTALSESLDPEKLTRLLNRYLTEMTDVIQSEAGTVDKYEGDAIIAFWNAPIDQTDHAARALTAAIRCLERLEAINPELASVAGAPLSMRIGLHSGPVVVGNMGSRDRFDYTVIGDAANLASRLEGLGKTFRSPILVSEETWSRANDVANGREIGRVRVVGRQTPTRLFQPTGLRDAPSLFPWWNADDSSFADGLRSYERGDFAGAIEAFGGAPDDPVAGAYAGRCRELLDSPPPGVWDGVWEMKQK